MIAVLSMTVGVVLLCLGLHLWVLGRLGRWVRSLDDLKFRYVSAMLFAAIVSHLIQIALFAIVISLVIALEQGQIKGTFVPGLRDYFYYSAVTYTTLGYGDLTPEGNLRFLAAIEALTGLVLVAWTASFGFLVMQSFVKTKRDDAS